MDWENFELNPCEGLTVAGKWAGSGNRLLLLIPGFGNDRHWFDTLFPEVPPGWKFACFDLPPFYGSDWTPDRPIGPDELKSWLESACEHFQATELHLLAFSLGARTALGMYLSAPACVNSLFLLSPDGLRVHPMYAFAMYSRIGRALFRRVLNHPARFLRIVRILYRLKLLSDSIFRLSMAQFESESRRKRLYKSWYAWSGTRPKLKEIAAATGQWGTKWHVLWGKQDEILNPRLGKRFCRNVPNATLHLVEGGHFMVKYPTQELKTTIWNLLTTQDAH